jgi:hypothetical protein
MSLSCRRETNLFSHSSSAFSLSMNNYRRRRSRRRMFRRATGKTQLIAEM